MCRTFCNVLLTTFRAAVYSSRHAFPNLYLFLASPRVSTPFPLFPKILYPHPCLLPLILLALKSFLVLFLYPNLQSLSRQMKTVFPSPCYLDPSLIPSFRARMLRVTMCSVANLPLHINKIEKLCNVMFKLHAEIPALWLDIYIADTGRRLLLVGKGFLLNIKVLIWIFVIEIIC